MTKKFPQEISLRLPTVKKIMDALTNEHIRINHLEITYNYDEYDNFDDFYAAMVKIPFMKDTLKRGQLHNDIKRLYNQFLEKFFDYAPIICVIVEKI